MDPVEIVADRLRGSLTVEWSDGTRSRLLLPALRWACPCATCAGEWGRPGRLASLTVLPDDELTLTDVQPVGSYGITPIWASGHRDGIYSFDYLKSLATTGA